MDRSKIKVIEFGDEYQGTEKSEKAPVATEYSRARLSQDGGIKIKEFNFGQELPGKDVAKAEDVKNIKIVEFDNEPLPAEKKSHHNTGSRSADVPSSTSINVFEYDDQGQLIDKKQEVTRRNGIKIVEF